MVETPLTVAVKSKELSRMSKLIGEMQEYISDPHLDELEEAVRRVRGLHRAPDTYTD